MANNTFVLSPSGEGNAYLINGGSITESTAWPVPTPGFCYGLYQDYVQLNSGAAIWQVHDAVLKMWSGSDIRIDGGRLIADGVVFTSRADDTLGSIDGNGDGGAPGQWEALDINGGASGTSEVNNCVIRYGGQGSYDAGMHLDNTGIIAEGNLFTFNLDAGLMVSVQNGGNKVRGNTFSNNSYPVRLHPGAVDSVVANNTFVLSPSGEGNAYLINGGSITESTAWPVPTPGFCYGLYQDYVQLNSGAAIWQVHDAVLKMWSGSDIRIDGGRLIADGVVFTSRADDTLGSIDGNGDGGAPGQWEALDINGGASGTSEVNNCVIRYGGQGSYDAGMHIDHASPSIGGSQFYFNQDAGVYASGGFARPLIHSCYIGANQSRGVWCAGSAVPEIEQCTISGNIGYGVYNNSSSVNVQAANNWWGDGSGPRDTSLGPPDFNPGGLGSEVSDFVSYRPWLGGPPAGPAPPAISRIVDPGTGNHLMVKWVQLNKAGVTDYWVYWGTEPGVWQDSLQRLEGGRLSDSMLIPGLEEHIPYFIGVRAHNALSGEFSTYSSSEPCTPNIPVVLVHGWKGGNPGTWTNYRSWLTASGFANIWIPELNSCGPEGEDQFDKNAQILATYILEQRDALQLSTGIQATEINLVAHSMGGLVSRRLIADQSSFGMNSIHVRSLTMLGTPNGGTLYANVACFPVCELSDWRIKCDENLGHLVCWGPATCELSSLNMQSFNAKYPPTVTDLAHFYAVAGTACCGLKRCKWSCSITGEAYNHDGVVAVTSVFGIPIFLNHRYLRSVKHEDLPRNKPDVFDPIVLPILLGNSPAPEMLMAGSDSDSSTSQTVYVSALPTDSLLWAEDTLALHNVSLATFWASGLSAEPEIELVPPGGGLIDSNSALMDTANYEYSHGSGIVALTVLNPADGNWIIRLRTHDWQDSVSVARVSVEVLSEVQLTLFNYLPIGEQSDSVMLHAKLSEGAIPVTGASVEIRAILGSDTLPWFVNLPDDGLGVDSVVGDGIYSGSFIQTQGAGVYTFMCNASGLTSQAIPFSRVAFLQTYVTGVGRGDMNHDGFYDVFDVVILIDYVFSGATPPYPDFIADANCDGYPDVFDIAYLIDYIFSGGPIAGCP